MTGETPPAAKGATEALHSCICLLETMAESAKERGDIAEWSMMSVMAEIGRAALSPLPAPEAMVEAQPTTIAFGEGKLVVDTGSFHGRPAVFIASAKYPGEVGASAAREGHDLHSLQPGEIVLTFPTDEQARAVEAALYLSTPAAPELAVKVKPLDETQRQGWRDDKGRFCIPLSDGLSQDRE